MNIPTYKAGVLIPLDDFKKVLAESYRQGRMSYAIETGKEKTFYSNNLSGEEKRAYTSVIIPDSKAYAQALTEFLNQPNLKYYIDYSDVESLQKERKQEAGTIHTIISALNAGLKTNLISNLEARTMLSGYMDIDPKEIPEKPQPQLPPPNQAAPALPESTSTEEIVEVEK